MARVLLVALVALAAERASRSGSPWRAATAQVAIGIIALAASATIAFAYATKTGLSTRAVAGFVAAAGCISLLIGGLMTLGRLSRGWRRWMIAPVALVAAFVVVSTIFPAVYATNVPRPRLGVQRPSDYGLSYLDATFETDDGFALSGWYIPSANGAAVVLLHGASSTRTSVLGQAAVLAEHGYGVLLFDARGHGHSEGRAMEFGWYGDRDIGAAIDYLQARPDVDPNRIGAVGMSMGGEEAIGAMAGDGRIKATVAEGATNRVYADKAWLADEYGIRGAAQLGIEWLTYHLADALTSATAPISLRDAVHAAAPRPVLLIVAGNVRDEQLAGRSIRSSAPDSVNTWVVDGAGHTGGMTTQPQEWARRVTGFLDAALILSS